MLQACLVDRLTGSLMDWFFAFPTAARWGDPTFRVFFCRRPPLEGGRHTDTQTDRQRSS